MHPWIGAGDEDRQRILTELGLSSIDELFSTLPASVCVDRIPIPDSRNEDAVVAELAAMAGANVTLDSRPSFLGAGVYRHLNPRSVCRKSNRMRRT